MSNFPGDYATPPGPLIPSGKHFQHMQTNKNMRMFGKYTVPLMTGVQVAALSTAVGASGPTAGQLVYISEAGSGFTVDKVYVYVGSDGWELVSSA